MVCISGATRMANNTGTIQAFSFEPDASSEEENKDVHESSPLQVDAWKWSCAGSLWPISCSLSVNSKSTFQLHLLYATVKRNLREQQADTVFGPLNKYMFWMTCAGESSEVVL